MWCNVVVAEKPEYSSSSLNENIVNYDWRHDEEEKKFISIGKTTAEIHTLKKAFNGKWWILKCQITYTLTSSRTICTIP